MRPGGCPDGFREGLTAGLSAAGFGVGRYRTQTPPFGVPAAAVSQRLFEPVVMEVRHGPPDSGGESMTWIVRIRPSARSCRARVPLCQSYHQRAPRSPLYSPESGAE